MGYTDVVFDIDGTLIDSTQAIKDGLDDLSMELIGRKLSPEEGRRGNGLPAGAGLEAMGLPGDEKTQEAWIVRMLSHWDEVEVFDGVEELLGALVARGLRLGAVTAETRSEMERGFASFGFSGLFSHIVVADDTRRHKPDPDPLEAYLVWSGARASDTLFVGDGLVDAACAEAAGVDFALARWRENPVKEDVRAVARLSHPREVLELL